MKQFRWPWMSSSDDEYIASLRRQIRLWDRFKFWYVLFQVALLIIAIWMLRNVLPLLAGIAPDGAPIALLGFVVGTMLGIVCAWFIYGILHGLMTVLTGMRAERMLVKLLDAMKSEACGDGLNHLPNDEPTETLEQPHSG